MYQLRAADLLVPPVCPAYQKEARDAPAVRARMARRHPRRGEPAPILLRRSVSRGGNRERDGFLEARCPPKHQGTPKEAAWPCLAGLYTIAIVGKFAGLLVFQGGPIRAHDHKMRGLMMKLTVLAAGSAAVLALTGAPGALRAADDTVKIGLEIPLSPPGDHAAGQLIRRGGELAVEYVNTVMGGVIGGRKIEIVVQDSQGRTESGIEIGRASCRERV